MRLIFILTIRVFSRQRKSPLDPAHLMEQENEMGMICMIVLVNETHGGEACGQSDRRC